MELNKCIILQETINSSSIDKEDGTVISYKTIKTGKVRITLKSYIGLYIEGSKNYHLGGLIRNEFDKKGISPIINMDMIRNFKEEYFIPISFEEKKISLLKYIHYHEEEGQIIDLDSSTDFLLTYGDLDVFFKVITNLESQNLISIRNKNQRGANHKSYSYKDISVTDSGLKYMNKLDLESSSFLNIDKKSKEEIIDMIKESNTKEAILMFCTICENENGNWRKKGILISKNYSKLINDEQKGIISYEDHNIGVNKILDMILNAIKP